MATPTPAPDAAGRGAVSIRTRLMVVVLFLVALALAVTGVTVFAIDWASSEKAANDHLVEEAEVFTRLAEEGRDPQTSQPFTSAAGLLRRALEHRVYEASDGGIGIVDDRVAWYAPDGVALRLEEDPELVRRALAVARRDAATFGRLATAGHDYRYVVVPVTFEGSGSQGALVRAIDLRLANAHLGEAVRTYVLVSLGALALAGSITWLAAGRLLQPVTWVRETAEAITPDDLTQRIPVRGHDDLSSLTRTINSMLDRVQRAVTGQRLLLDDVSHELRTPLTVVRGHLELMDASDPDDVHTSRLVALDELDRMRSMVDDLLTLGHAGRDDFVRPEPVDVGRLTDETLEKARALGERRWVLDDLADVAASLDPDRITQAWLQLAGNAVKYSATGSVVALGSRVEGDDLRLWVRDEGIGIAPGDRELVLSRFGRTSAARAIDPNGAGLGLVIVNSIAEAHGGRVDITSHDGPGTTISIVLPLPPTPEPDPQEGPVP